MTDTATMTPLPLPGPDVVFCDVEGGAVLLSTATETYYGLNPVGARVWALLPPVSTTLEEVCSELLKDYPDVERAVLEQDVALLLEDLKANRLVV